jgi:hypothetical protein
MGTKIEVKTLLLSLARLSEGNRHALVDLEKAAAEAGLSEEQTVVAAQFLRRRGWARFEVLTGNGYVQITSDGLEEANELQVPAWRRWAWGRVAAVALIVSLLTNFLVIALGELIPWWLTH